MDDALIAARPDDPYYLELKGQFLLESGQRRRGGGGLPPGGGAGAQGAAASSAGSAGRSSTWTTTAATAEARDVLRTTRRGIRPNGDVLRDLALAEARLGNEGAAALATAERFTLDGPIPRRRAQRRARGGAPARGLAGLAAGPGYDYHRPTRAELKDAHATHPPRPGRAALTLLAALPAPRRAQAPESSPVSDAEREAFHAEVRAYLLENPEILTEMISLLEDQQQGRDARGRRGSSSPRNAAALFDDGFSWVGGNPEGELTVVEFLDYQCGFCRRAQPDVAELLEHRRRHPPDRQGNADPRPGLGTRGARRRSPR